MSARMVRSLSVVSAIVIASLAVGILAAPALAKPSLTGSVSTPYPQLKHDVTVSAKLLDSRGKPVIGRDVVFTWRFSTGIKTSVVHTNRSGIARSRRNVGSAPIWRTVPVVLSAKVGTTKVSGKASFVPVPIVTSTSFAPVEIASAVPMTAGAVTLGQGMVRGAGLAIAKVNASPEAKAARVRFTLVKGDDQGDPAVAMKLANTLVADGRVLGVAGHLNSGCSIPASGVYSRFNVPMVTGVSTNPMLTQLGYGNVFRNTYSDAFQGPAAADAAFAAGARKVYVVDDSTPYGEMLADEFFEAFTDNGGVTAIREKTSDFDTDFTITVAHIKDAAPEAVYYGGIYNSGALLSKQLGDGGVTVPVYGGDGLYDQEYINLGGRNGDICTSPGYPVEGLPGLAGFRAAYEPRFPSQTIEAYDAYSYDSVKVITGAVLAEARAHGPALVGTPAGRKGIIKRISATDMQGVTGRIRFNSVGDRLDPVISLCQVSGNKWVYQPSTK